LEGAPPAQRYTDEEQRALSGRFLDPISNSVLTVTFEGGQARHTFLSGAVGYLMRSQDGFSSWPYAVGEPLRLRLGNRGLEANIADWNEFRAMTRIGDDYRAPSADTAALSGAYYSPTYGSIYHIDPIPEGLQLRINAGARHSDVYALTALAQDVYEAEQTCKVCTFDNMKFQLVVQRSNAGEVTGLMINANNVRGFEIDRIKQGAL
ncbi:MAG: hypothetical protein AAGF46_10855, partial [Pseudomonadota bacterium]